MLLGPLLTHFGVILDLISLGLGKHLRSDLLKLWKACKKVKGIAKTGVRRMTTSMKDRLGRQVWTNFEAKLACLSASWS